MRFKQVETLQDIEILISLIQEIWPEVFIPIIGKAQVDYMLVHYQGRDVITEEINRGKRYFLIEFEDAPVGYFAYSLVNDIKTSFTSPKSKIVSQLRFSQVFTKFLRNFVNTHKNDCLYISKIYLKKEFRGKGLSSKVFDHFEEVARNNGKQRLFLRVNRFNKQAIDVYLHRGFVITESIDEPLGDFVLNDYCMHKRV